MLPVIGDIYKEGISRFLIRKLQPDELYRFRFVRLSLFYRFKRLKNASSLNFNAIHAVSPRFSLIRGISDFDLLFKKFSSPKTRHAKQGGAKQEHGGRLGDGLNGFDVDKFRHRASRHEQDE